MAQPARRLVSEIDFLEAIHQELLRLNANLERASGGASGKPPEKGRPGGEALREGAPSPQVADDADLDSQWGNPTIRKDPPRWQGDSYAGMPMSEASSEYLDSLAGFLEWCAQQSDKKNELANNGEPRSKYLRRDAARARGWALRNGSRPTRTVVRGSKASEEPIPWDETSDDDVPF